MYLQITWAGFGGEKKPRFVYETLTFEGEIKAKRLSPWLQPPGMLCLCKGISVGDGFCKERK